ncbi:uncharacterized protein N7482_000657 [Penicillium canariense]|uniref:Uncharacterized protein n=1 Tax=Penicillium canariense TaxID=189055 RepID=A0A9W9ICE4_9EURO|nr:uncharacterized protein N7482_000657 [Penicillium canariense]KAJ5174780.1 hypothetical protein N7482_000657 [Penicillium canariense]
MDVLACATAAQSSPSGPDAVRDTGQGPASVDYTGAKWVGIAEGQRLCCPVVTLAECTGGKVKGTTGTEGSSRMRKVESKERIER